MTAMSDYLESQIVQHIFRTSTFTKPTVLAIALCSAAPTDADTGSLTGKEIGNAGAYARVTLNPLDSNYGNVVGGNGTTTNTGAITYTTANADWGTVSHLAICDSGSYGGGNLLFWGSLTANKVVSSGDTFSFAASSLSVQIDS